MELAKIRARALAWPLALAFAAVVSCSFDTSALPGFADPDTAGASAVGTGGTRSEGGAGGASPQASGNAGNSAGAGGGGGDGGDGGNGGSGGGGGVAGIPVPPPEAFGLRCSDVTCPLAVGGTEQCCTSEADVSENEARSADKCGVTFASDGACYENDQPGVLDNACPVTKALGSGNDEPGCCTDEGRCGTFDGLNGLGCHYNPDVDESCLDIVSPDVGCEPTGHFAIRAAVDVVWGGASAATGGLIEITDDGRGDITILLLATLREVDDDGTFTAEVRPCRAELPPFYSSILCESYRPVFPDPIWDSSEMPVFDVAGAYQCNNPGCILTFEPFTGLIGIDLDDPNGLWPTPANTGSFPCAQGNGLDCFLDHDGDDEPGVRVTLSSTGSTSTSGTCGTYNHQGAPLNANPLAIIGGVRRADRILLGTRVRLGGSGRIADDCVSSMGEGVAEFVESRAAGCYVQPGTADPFGPLAGPMERCTDTERLFMNENLPIYTILRQGESPDASLTPPDTSASDGTRFALRRLGDIDEDISCEDVRGVSW